MVPAAITAVAAAFALIAPAAQAATVYEDGYGLRYSAAAGETNYVTISLASSGPYSVEETGAILAVGAGCTALDDHHATCDRTYSPELYLNDGDDTAFVDGQPPCDPYHCQFGFTGQYRVEGYTGNDTIVASGSAANARAPNILIGGGGNDILRGGPGSDLLLGDRGNDILRGGGGSDSEQGGTGNDRFVAEAAPDGSDTLSAGGSQTEGVDTLDLSARGSAALDVELDESSSPGHVTVARENDTLEGGFDNVRGGAGNDTIVGNNLPNRLDGNRGNDVLRGRDGPDTLIGGGGNDTLDGQAGPDVLDGLAGTDTADYSGHAGAVKVRIDDIANDGNAGDGLEGARDNVRPDVENLVGTPWSDTLDGSSFANVLDGGFGADVLRGRGGLDTASYAGRTSGVLVRLDGLANDGNAQDYNGRIRDNVDRDVENVVGGSGPDTIFGSDLANRITGGPGADKLRGLGGNDTMLAKDGDGDDVLCGLGTDSLTADSGADTYPTSGAETCEKVTF